MPQIETLVFEDSKTKSSRKNYQEKKREKDREKAQKEVQIKMKTIKKKNEDNLFCEEKKIMRTEFLLSTHTINLN